MSLVYCLQNGQVMYYAHLRHADARMCPVAADGMLQMYRFGIKGYPFPDLRGDAADWWVWECTAELQLRRLLLVLQRFTCSGHCCYNIQLAF